MPFSCGLPVAPLRLWCRTWPSGPLMPTPPALSRSWWTGTGGLSATGLPRPSSFPTVKGSRSTRL